MGNPPKIPKIRRLKEHPDVHPKKEQVGFPSMTTCNIHPMKVEARNSPLYLRLDRR
jgi:hypothetical protein